MSSSRHTLLAVMLEPDSPSQNKRKAKVEPEEETLSKRRCLRETRKVDYRLVKPEEMVDELDVDVDVKMEEKPAVELNEEVVKKEEGKGEVLSADEVQLRDEVQVQNVRVQRTFLDCVMITLEPRRRPLVADEAINVTGALEDQDIEDGNNNTDSEFVEDDEEEDEDEDFDHPDFVPVPVYAKRYASVKAPLREIYIKGSGLSYEDKEEIAATLGDLELVTVPGIEKQMYMSRKHLDQYYYWCAERQKIFEKRERGEPGPWTQDDLFYAKTSNVFRHEDRTSQFLIKHVIDGYKCDPPPAGDNSDPRWKNGVWVDTIEEACWRVMVLWQFGKMETWEVLRKGLPGGDVRWATYDEEVYTKILGDAVETGFKLFTGSYQIHPDKRYDGKFNYENAMRSISHLMREGIPKFYSVTTSLEEAWNKIQSYWGIGHYHGLQLTLHLNYIRGISLSTTDWICNGRGAKNGLSLILPELSPMDKEQLKGMKWLMSQQWDQWKRLGFTPMSGFSNAGFSAPVPGVSLVDIENSLCLWQKYQREHRKRELAERRGEIVPRNEDRTGLRI